MYARQMLVNADGTPVQWWSKQIEVAESLLKHRRVFVKASHSVGKTHLGGGLVNWFFDCWDPGITLTTAPTKAQVEDLLWKEVRVQRGQRSGLLPKAARLEAAPNHFASGYTATDASSFQGRHEERLLMLYDEAVGIDAPFWDAGEGMFTGDGCYWLVIMNPTDTASRAYMEETTGGWHVITISALDHPNIAADLEGRPAPFPAAVRLSFVEERIRKWTTPIDPADHRAQDIEFPPGSGKWYRPGPLFEGRVLGRWPTQSGTSVWSEAMWQASQVMQPDPDEPTEIGCDVARFGDDYTSIIVRRGACCLHHETHNGWSTSQTAGQLKVLAKRFARTPAFVAGAAVAGEDPTKIKIKVDDDGVGGGVTDQKGEFNFLPVSGGGRPAQVEDYPNRRSELWFATADRADASRLDVSRLSEESRNLIRQQVMAPTWKMDAQGRRVVEPKADTKKRIGRSPDDADALNLAFAAPVNWAGDAGLMEWLINR